ncbi:MAG TPA: GTP-binding protein [Phycisphaerales bacterium]|nr:GTP-binding protein [Phycisphaerales bacterium]
MAELKFIFTGSPGAGKTTAIAAISEIPPISTDVLATDELADVKNETTAAMDFGEFTLDDGQKVRLYGTPGQQRFEHMWRILAEGALGFVILVDNTRPAPLDDLAIYLDNFADFIDETAVVIGVTRTDIATRHSMVHFQDFVEQRGLVCPVFPADVRDKDDVLLLLDALMASLEYA